MILKPCETCELGHHENYPCSCPCHRKIEAPQATQTTRPDNEIKKLRTCIKGAEMAVRDARQVMADIATQLETALSKIKSYMEIDLDKDKALNLASTLLTARHISEWHEDIGDVLWWEWPITEPPYVGSPLYEDFPKYMTHWTPIVEPVYAVDGDKESE